MDHVPSKSWLHKWMKRIPVDLLDSLLGFTAGGDARRTLSVDSTRYTFNGMSRWRMPGAASSIGRPPSSTTP